MAAPIHAKVAAGAIAGAIVTVAIYLLSLFGVTMPGEVAAALTTLLTAAAGYLKAA